MTTDKNNAAPDPQPAELAERKGVELPPLPHTHYNACSDGSEPLYSAEQMQEYARAALAARQPGAQAPHGSEFAVSRTMEDAEAASDGMLPAALVPVADEWYRLCERRFSVDRIRISWQLAEAIVEAVCAIPPAQGIDLGQLPDGWSLRTLATCYQLSDGNQVVGNFVGPDAEKNAALIAALIDQRDAATGVSQ